jgi:chemotaxis protein MotB
MKLGSIVLKSIGAGVACSVLLLTAGCVSKSKYDTQVQKANNYQQLNAQLRSQLSADDAKIQVLQNELKVTMVNEVLFSEGGWSLSKQGEQALAKIAPTLATLPADQQIIIQGYTDNLPLSAHLKEKFPSNIELSAARAGAVLRYLAYKGVPQNIMSEQGFGDTKPVASNDTSAGRAENRRVEIIITSAVRP